MMKEIISSTPANPGDWVSLIEVVILSLTLLASIIFTTLGLRAQRKEFKAQRKHHQISVEPILAVFRITHITEPSVLEVRNVGLGPAKIKSVAIHCLGREFDGSNSADLNLMLFCSGIGGSKIGWVYFGASMPVPAHDSFCIFKAEPYTGTTLSSGDRLDIQEFFDQLKVVIEYEDMYGNQLSCGKGYEVPDLDEDSKLLANFRAREEFLDNLDNLDDTIKKLKEHIREIRAGNKGVDLNDTITELEKLFRPLHAGNKCNISES